MKRDNYLELPVADIPRAKAFYASALGANFSDFGPAYAATMTGSSDMGLQADKAEQSVGPLVVMGVDDLDATLAAVIAAGGVVTKPVFAFPGGRRFHFRDLDGHELAAMQPDG